MASLRQVKEAYRKAGHDTLKDVGNVILESGNEVIQREAFDRGDLLASGEVKIDKENSSGIVRWSAKHAPFVNFGTRPHWPPLGPILAWVKRNLVRFQDTSGKSVDVIRPGGSIAQRARKSPDSTALRVARAIQAKIAREGTAPVPFAHQGAAVAKQKMPTLLKENIDRRLKNLGNR